MKDILPSSVLGHFFNKKVLMYYKQESEAFILIKMNNKLTNQNIKYYVYKRHIINR